jgi:hypothetical protein
MLKEMRMSPKPKDVESEDAERARHEANLEYPVRAFHEAIVAYEQANPGVSKAAAATAVAKKNPGLQRRALESANAAETVERYRDITSEGVGDRY